MAMTLYDEDVVDEDAWFEWQGGSDSDYPDRVRCRRDRRVLCGASFLPLKPCPNFPGTPHAQQSMEVALSKWLQWLKNAEEETEESGDEED